MAKIILCDDRYSHRHPVLVNGDLLYLVQGEEQDVPDSVVHALRNSSVGFKLIEEAGGSGGVSEPPAAPKKKAAKKKAAKPAKTAKQKG